jgi:hypothetical protein
MEASKDFFERARVKPAEAVRPRRPERVLLAVDGSSQDHSATKVAEHLRDQYECAVFVVDAREHDDSNNLALQTAGTLGAQATTKTPGDSYEQILQAIRDCQADFLIAPCPYGRDLETVGPNSAGTVIDVLLSRSPVPILVIRRPFEETAKVFRHVRMVLTAENEAARPAAARATALITPGGLLELVLVLEKEMYENVRALLQTIAPDVELTAESMSHALAHAHMNLHRSLQKTAKQVGFEYRLQLLLEGEEPIADGKQPPRVLRVLALERADHSSQGNVRDRIRLSPDPLLVVCRD